MTVSCLSECAHKKIQCTVHVLYLVNLLPHDLLQEYIKVAHIKERQRLIRKTEEEKVIRIGKNINYTN